MRSSGARVWVGWTWAASIALHAAAISGLGWVALRAIERREAEAAAVQTHTTPGSGTIELELPGVAVGTLVSERPRDPAGDPPPPSGGSPTPALDDNRRGRGGDPRVDAPASNLSDRDDRISRTLDLLDRLDRNQESRLKTNDKHDRESWEDRRSSKQPTELTFVAEGNGARLDRRRSAPDPSRGSNVPSSPSALGGTIGDRANQDDGPEVRADLGASREGSTESAPGLGVRDGRAGCDHRASAHVARARPDVVLAAVSVPAARRGRPRDDIDSDQEVATLVRSIVHASTAGGALGEGHGGTANGGEAGAGGRTGAGSSGRPLGVGNDWWDMGTTDPRLVSYFRRIHSKLDPLWAHAFPMSAALDLQQGTVIFDVTIAHDGAVTVAWPPRRPSGIPEFDRNCYDAIRRGAPFDPIPASLGANVLRVRMPFDARNYMVP